MQDALVHEAHPQFRMGGLLRALKLGPQLRAWVDHVPAAPQRNRLVSLAMRPAPVTDQWISDGPRLGDLCAATAGMTLIEAISPRQEALAIALVLREAVAKGEKACLISPDRSLTRRVAAALDRWGLRPDDSAGQPLQQTAPGRLLRLTAKAMGRVLAVDEVLVLLKHPLTQTGADRGPHLKLTRDLELHLRRRGPAFPDADFLGTWAAARPEAGAAGWGASVGAVLQALATAAEAPMAAMVRQHRALSEALCQGIGAGSGKLWEEAPGKEALSMMEELAREAPEGFVLSPADYALVMAGVMGRHEARSAVLADDRVEILGVQEARTQGADLVVLGGLTEGSWPETPAPDPWLNRRLRRDAGLLLPERKVGLSAHDFQIAIAAPRVVMTRAHRNAEAETVPSRWLNRLTNLLAGLPAQGGDAALAGIKARGERVLHLASALEAADAVAPATRPAPRPPVAARPRKLSITEVERLVTDPYEIYARHVLKLDPLNPLRPEADFRKRGEVVHEVLERFLRAQPLPDIPEAAADLLMQIAVEVLAREVPWPVARAEWLARMRRIALPFAQATLRRVAVPVLLEEKAGMGLDGLDFTLTGKPDRIDLLPDGTVEVIDYKSGAVPAAKDVASHRKQLHLAAVMVLEGAFEGVGARLAARITYQSMKPGLDTYDEVLDEAGITEVKAGLLQLIGAYLSPETGFAARRAAVNRDYGGDYDHLSRFGEWTAAETAQAEDME
jgi:ATP-dependent helicase/nuclease subunit B